MKYTEGSQPLLESRLPTSCPKSSRCMQCFDKGKNHLSWIFGGKKKNQTYLYYVYAKGNCYCLWPGQNFLFSPSIKESLKEIMGYRKDFFVVALL